MHHILCHRRVLITTFKEKKRSQWEYLNIFCVHGNDNREKRTKFFLGFRNLHLNLISYKQVIESLVVKIFFQKGRKKYKILLTCNYVNIRVIYSNLDRILPQDTDYKATNVCWAFLRHSSKGFCVPSWLNSHN